MEQLYLLCDWINFLFSDFFCEDFFVYFYYNYKIIIINKNNIKKHAF